ncbi:MAG: MBL fold metallo-hydrolase [Caldilineaceae bacterium]
MPTHYTQLSASLFVHHGSCNVGILREGARVLLIDCGNGDLQTSLTALGVTQIDAILFTHHHRDSASGVTELVTATTRIGVPAQERPWFEQVESFWHNPQMRWHLYNIHPHNLMLAASVRVDEVYAEGDTIKWGAATIQVLAAPGHTDGSTGYLVLVDGGRFLFCGDAIYDKGQLWDLYSLQKGETTTDYHGFLGDRNRLLQSLDKLVATQPDLLIPTHGNIMENPAYAVASLRQRLDHAYDRYVAISALRHYFPALFADYAGRPDHMPIRAGTAVPDFLRHIGTTWILLAQNGEALVMDCGTEQVITTLQAWQATGEIGAVTACWVTHYHDDHVDAMPQFQAAFPCPTYADPVVAEVVTNPHGWRLPCISPEVVRIDQCTQAGTTWWWNEFRLTAYHFPGQTYYHGGLLVEGNGMRLFFGGDSFTMAGIDDYCTGNRNLLGADVGYDRCLALLAELQPTHIFNCHVACAFDFTSAEIDQMRRILAEREQIYGELVPWDHANYGLDEHWVRCYPYEQTVTAGETAPLTLVITNHSATAQLARCHPILPKTWNSVIDAQELIIPPKVEGKLHFAIPIPAQLAGDSRRLVIPIELTYAGRALGQFREAIFVLSGA